MHAEPSPRRRDAKTDRIRTGRYDDG